MRHGPTLRRQQRGEEQQVAPSPAPGHPLIVPAIGLVLLALLTAVHGSWAAQVLLVPLLLIVPGVILLRALRIPGAVVAAESDLRTGRFGAGAHGVRPCRRPHRSRASG